MIPTLHIHLLGDFLLVSGDTPVTTVTIPRVQSLLAYLVLHRTAPQSRSHLAFLLWPESTEIQARANLRKVLYQLQHTLPFADAFLSIDKHNLHWQSSPDACWTLDIVDFEQTLAQVEQVEKAQNVTALRQTLEQAVCFYRGDLLLSCYDEWILPERDRLRQLYFQASQQLILLLEQERDYDAAIKAAHRLLRLDSLHESAYRQLMRLYALHGNRAAALRVYHTCATVLERELAAEPSEATRQVYESLMQENISSQPRTGSLSPRGVGTSLIGRKQEWRQLQTAWRSAASGHPQMILLSGEAGIGKTRLAEEMVAWVSRQGMTTASAQCYVAEGRLPYAPVTAWLRANAVQPGLSSLADVWLTEVARLMPDLLTRRPDLPRPTPLSEGWQRQHFFEALARTLLSTRQPLLLLLDDLQWCDNETLEWLHYLLRFEPGACLLLIGTVRSEETFPAHPLLGFLRALQREGLVTDVALRPLDTTEMASLAEQLVGHQLDPDMIATLYHETEGNPLFVVEIMRTVGQGGREQHYVDTTLSLLTQRASMLPSQIQTVLATRLAQLSPLARELANLAAVIGREFSFAVLAQTSSKDEEVLVRGLDELWQRRIVREQGGDAYDFSHDKLREQAYTSLSTAHRRLLHRRVAEALEAVHADTLDVVSRQMAVHYECAGLPWKAISSYQRAGEAARRIYANAEAITAYQQAAALLEETVGAVCSQQDWQWEIAAQVYTHLGDLLGMTGHYQEARQAYQQGRVHVPEQAFLWQAQLQRKIAKAWNYSSKRETLLNGYTEAERILEQVLDKSSLEWWQEWLELQLDQLLPLQVHRVSVQEMTKVIEKIQPIVEQYGTAAQRAQFFLSTAARNIAHDRYMVSEETVVQFRCALLAVQQTRNMSLIGFARFGLGASLFYFGSLDEAEEQMHAAMNVAEEIGNVILLERCFSFLPLIFRQRGQVEEVRHVITCALTVPEMTLTSMMVAHHAWLAWRGEEMDKAEEYGRAAIEEWQHRKYVNPHQWTGLWPLIGVMLVQERLSEAMQYVRMLLMPTQQPPPEALKNLLEAAVQAWEAEQYDRVHSLLQRAVPLAKGEGYL